MNDQLRTLVRQAVVAVDIVTGNEALDDELAKMYIPDCFAEKFAELIVRECVTICEEQKEMYAMLNETAGEDATWAAMTTAATSCGTGIKKHFGVEE